MKKLIAMRVLPLVVNQLLGLLPGNILREGLDALFDKIEDRVADSDTPIDDQLALPVIRMLRSQLDIPDGDD